MKTKIFTVVCLILFFPFAIIVALVMALYIPIDYLKHKFSGYKGIEEYDTFISFSTPFQVYQKIKKYKHEVFKNAIDQLTVFVVEFDDSINVILCGYLYGLKYSEKDDAWNYVMKYDESDVETIPTDIFASLDRFVEEKVENKDKNKKTFLCIDPNVEIESPKEQLTKIIDDHRLIFTKDIKEAIEDN